MSIYRLYNDCLFTIFSYLSDKEFHALSITCSYFYRRRNMKVLTGLYTYSKLRRTNLLGKYRFNTLIIDNIILAKNLAKISQIENLIFKQPRDLGKKTIENNFLRRRFVKRYFNNIKSIKFSYDFKEEIIYLPDTVKTLIFSDKYNHPFILPPKIEKLILGRDFQQRFKMIPASLKIIYLYSGYNYLDEIPKSTEIIYLNHGPYFGYGGTYPSLYEDKDYPENMKKYSNCSHTYCGHSFYGYTDYDGIYDRMPFFDFYYRVTEPKCDTSSDLVKQKAIPKNRRKDFVFKNLSRRPNKKFNDNKNRLNYR